MAAKKRGRGRPRLPAREKLVHRVWARITAEQMGKWKRAAKREKFPSVTDWIVATCDAKAETE